MITTFRDFNKNLDLEIDIYFMNKKRKKENLHISSICSLDDFKDGDVLLERFEIDSQGELDIVYDLIEKNEKYIVINTYRSVSHEFWDIDGEFKIWGESERFNNKKLHDRGYGLKTVNVCNIATHTSTAAWKVSKQITNIYDHPEDKQLFDITSDIYDILINKRSMIISCLD